MLDSLAALPTTQGASLDELAFHMQLGIQHIDRQSRARQAGAKLSGAQVRCELQVWLDRQTLKPVGRAKSKPKKRRSVEPSDDAPF